MTNDDPMTPISAAIPAYDHRVNSKKKWRVVIFRKTADGKMQVFIPVDSFRTWAEANAVGISMGMTVNKMIEAAQAEGE